MLEIFLNGVLMIISYPLSLALIFFHLFAKISAGSKSNISLVISYFSFILAT